MIRTFRRKPPLIQVLKWDGSNYAEFGKLSRDIYLRSEDNQLEFMDSDADWHRISIGRYIGKDEDDHLFRISEEYLMERYVELFTPEEIKAKFGRPAALQPDMDGVKEVHNG